MAMLSRIPISRRHSGVTLIELMIVITIVAILAGLGAPSLRTFIATQRIRSASGDLVLQLNFTRSEAIKQNAGITMASVSGTTAWASGWNISGSGGDLKKQGAYTGVTITSSVTNLVYNRSGRTTAGVTFEVADATTGSSIQPRCVTVGLTGQPVAKQGSC